MQFISKIRLPSRLPLWLKLAYTLFVLILVPFYWREYGVVNFLRGSDIALLVTVFGLWLENRLLVSTMAVGVLLPELVWNIDFFSHLFTTYNVFGVNLTSYMFNEEIPLFVRGLSLFHVFLPVVLCYAILRLGYDSRALLAQCILSWIVLPVSYFFTDPGQNINEVFGFGAEAQSWMSADAYLVLLMLAYPVLVYLPSHLALKYFSKTIHS